MRAVTRTLSPLRRPFSGALLAVLIGAFLLPGLFGHDPWKTEDAIGFGVVFDMLERGSWLTPHLAGEPFLEDGPLYYWMAASFARLAAPFLPLHDGARLASFVCVLLALYFTRLAARELYGRVQGDLSVLALMGCLGLLVHARETTAETAMLAAVAAAYYGLAIAWKKPLKAGIFFGAGAGAAFLSKGLVALIPPLAAALLLIPVAVIDRARSFSRAVAIGIVVMLPLIAVWPLAVANVAPGYWLAWRDFQLHNIARPLRLDTLLDYVKTLAWTAWPAWPLALWAAWEYRRRLRNPGFAVPFIASLVSFVLLLFAGTSHELDTLALLVPLSIPAGAAAMGLRRGAANALTWFGLMTFSLLALGLWVMWAAMMTGFPPALARNVAKLEPGFVPHLSVIAIAVALAFSAGWVYLVARTEEGPMRSLPVWAAGMTLVWGVAMTLWIDWVDYGKTYRSIGTAIRRLVPEGACVASQSLGEVQRAVLDYHARLLTQRRELGLGNQCRYLLVQGSSTHPELPVGSEWKKLWEGSRPRDRERYRLYVRNDAARAAVVK